MISFSRESSSVQWSQFDKADATAEPDFSVTATTDCHLNK